MLAVELLDELFDGARGAAVSLVRDDLGLGYAELGLLASLPAVVGSLAEVPIGLLATGTRRRVAVSVGGLAFASSLVVAGLAPAFPVLLLAMTAFWPSSGAFVSVSQVVLMDAEPGARERNMARWAVAGSVGATAGPFVIAAAGGWRAAYVGIGVLSLLALRAMAGHGDVLGGGDVVRVADGVRRAWRAARSGAVLRPLLVVEGSNLLLDVLTGFAAVYLVDAAGASTAVAALAIGVRQVVGLAGEVALVRLLDRRPGGMLLVPSSLVALGAYATFLLVPGVWPKVAALAVVTLATVPWYPLLSARVYDALGDDSNLAVALGAVGGAVGGLLPGLVGATAELAGLQAAMWVLAAAPLLVWWAASRRPDAGTP